MKSFIYITIFCIVIALTNTGCVGTIYSATVDERNISTITDDKTIEWTILKRMADKESGDILNVSVTSYEGRVFIVGEYENYEQKNRILRIAKGVEGVKSVSSYMIKSDPNHPCGTQEDVTITAKVKANLIADKSIWSTNVNVSTLQCEVVLWGTVGTKEEVSKSIFHAKSVTKVRGVKSFLKYK